MDTKIKNAVGMALVVGVILLGFSAVGYVRSYAKATGPTADRSFGVRAEGKVVAVPDVATFSFSVVTEGGNDLTTLQTKNTERVNQAIAYVKEEGVADEDVRTSAYDVQPRYQHYSCTDGRVCPPASIVGYTITQTVAVKARDFSRVGNLLAGVVENGANTVSRLQFTLDDPMKAEAEAKGLAIKHAREQAEIIAREGGFRLGKLLSIEEGGTIPIPVYDGYSVANQEMKAVAAAPSIQPGSQEIIVPITLRYEIR